MPHPSHKSTTELCDVCESIDFNRYLSRKISRNVSLGTWGQIVERHSCPFCRLVVRALRANSIQTLLHPDNSIVLNNWESWELGIECSPHDRLKSEAYSNMLDLRSEAKRCENIAHRFVISVESAQAVQAYIQFLAPRELAKGERQFFGRFLDREKVNIRLLKSWLDRCKTWHDDVCDEDGIAGRRLPDNLRLIDVRNRTIVKAPHPKRLYYVTLSYVWGTEHMEAESGRRPVVTNRADIRKTTGGKESTPLPEWLPRTIEDAISLTHALGYRYLWVDALCIIQDDPDHIKKRYLDKMDAVYNCSALTIAAASGRHADCGISGISVPRKTQQYSEVVNGLQLATMSPSFSELEGSQSLVWNTRGWTFQEKILAKRILLFTDFQVYYRCSEAIWTEEIIMETGKLSKSVEARAAKYRWAADRPHYAPNGKSLLVKMVVPQLNIDDEWNYLGMFPDYASAVREYTQRTLTKPDDTLIAINGVFRTLQPDSGDFYFGLPSAYFLQSLLWYPEPGSRIQRANQELPSWSWASWQIGRGVSYDVLDVRMLRAIMIVLQKLFIGVGHALSAMAGPGSGDSSSSDTSSYSPSSSSSSSSSTKPPSAAGPPGPSAPWKPIKTRTWSAMSIVTKASMNMSTCFGYPLLVRDHTIKDIILCSDGEVTMMNCGQTFALSTFLEPMEDDIASDNGSTSSFSSFSAPKPRDITNSEFQYHKKLASKIKMPLLSMRTVIVHFSVGACLHHREPTNENESSVFELLDSEGLCVGEVWTTFQMARKGREKPLEFITVCWGLSMAVAQIAEKHIPRWTFDSAELPEAKKFVTYRGHFESLLETLSPPRKSLKRNLSGESKKSVGGGNEVEGGKREQPPAMAFFEALFKAKKGEARPKFLWSTVNLILIERDRALLRRVGVGTVIFNAWLEMWNPPEEVLLA